MDCMYLVICRCELESHLTDFIDWGSSKFFNDKNSAINYGVNYVKDLADYPACAGYTIYKLLEDDEK